MAVQAHKQKTPQRTSQQYIPGLGITTPPTSTVATQPVIGAKKTTVYTPELIAADQEVSPAVSVGALAAGASSTITTFISFPNLPPISFKSSDAGYFAVLPQVYHAINGLCIASIQIVPQGLVNGTWITAGSIQGGQTYSAWRAKVVVLLVAAAASGAGSLNVGGLGTLVLLPPR